MWVCFTSGGMCPRCICPLVMCCLAWGMEPIWKLSGPPAPERMMAGRATEPVSTLPTLLNCCCSTVDLEWCYKSKGKRTGKLLGQQIRNWVVDAVSANPGPSSTHCCWLQWGHYSHQTIARQCISIFTNSSHLSRLYQINSRDTLWWICV